LEDKQKDMKDLDKYAVVMKNGNSIYVTRKTIEAIELSISTTLPNSTVGTFWGMIDDKGQKFIVQLSEISHIVPVSDWDKLGNA
jgi:hypothetical protein